MVYTYLGHIDDEDACHTGRNDHEHSESIGRIDEKVYGQHQTEGGTDTHQDHYYVHRDADEPWVIDVVVLDVAALIGKEQPEDHQETLVHIECTNEVAKVGATVALFIDSYCICSLILWKSVSWWRAEREGGRDSVFAFRVSSRKLSLGGKLIG